VLRRCSCLTIRRRDCPSHALIRSTIHRRLYRLFTSVMVAALFVVFPVRRNQFNAALLELLAKWVGIIATVG